MCLNYRKLRVKRNKSLVWTVFPAHLAHAMRQSTHQCCQCFDSRLLVCVAVLRPSQPNEVMSSAVSLPIHTFAGQVEFSKRLTSIVHIWTDNRPSWISIREKMTVENISWSNLNERMLPIRRASNPQPLDNESDAHQRKLYRLGRFSAIIYKEDNFYDIPFVFRCT